MELTVTTIVNDYRSANTHIVSTLGSNKVILIDVGGPEIDRIVCWLDENKKEVEAVFLTHEHADHCVGINPLFQKSPFRIFGSKHCLENIKNSRQNFSFYTDEIPTFEIHRAAQMLADGDIVKIEDITIVSLETPGHSPGSMCFLMENLIFTGDTILNGIKSPLNFPHSNRANYRDSIDKIKNHLHTSRVVYPGHGDEFIISNNTIDDFCLT